MEYLERINEVMAPYVLLIAIAGIIISIVLIVLLVRQTRSIRKLKHRMDYFMRSSDGDSLEEVLKQVIDDNQRVKLQMKNNLTEIGRANEMLTTAYRKIGIVKYNAFPGMAGKMSSSIALLNNEDNGIVINTMHGPEGCYTYVKEIMNGKSINPLTKEDEEALKSALQMQV